MFELKTIIDRLNENNIKTFKAIPEREDIQIEDSNDESDIVNFIDLMKSLDVKVAFIHAHFLTEEEVMDNIIGDDDYLASYESLFKSHVKDHNRVIQSLKSHIGKETQINVFFASHGVIYSLLLTNNELDYTRKGDLLSDLKEQYEEQIDNIKQEKYKQQKIEESAFVERLIKYLKTDEEFKECTNKSLRKNYYYRILARRKDVDMNYPEGMLGVDVDAAIERAWVEIKLSMKK